MRFTNGQVKMPLNGSQRVPPPSDADRIARLEKAVGLILQQLKGLTSGNPPVSNQPQRTVGPAEFHGDAGRVTDVARTAASGRAEPQGQAKDEVALSGEDGAKAETLLSEAKRQGAATLSSLLGRALKRHLKDGYDIQGPLFDEAELAELTRAFEATCATAELLGRARIREKHDDDRQDKPDSAGGDHSGQPNHSGSNGRHGDRPAESFAYDQAKVNTLTAGTKRIPFHSFAEQPRLKPFPPRKALEYFRKLVPSLGVDPQRFGADNARRAFTLAGRTSLELRERVQKAIADTLATGDVPTGEALVRDLLERVGASRRDPSYASMVFRTNMIDAYQVGATQEMQHPDVVDDFPAWQWVAIDDDRLRDSHRKHAFDEHGQPRYYPNHVSFQQVRDAHGFDGYNDRCNFRPVHKREWAELQKKGVGFSAFSEKSAINAIKSWTGHGDTPVDQLGTSKRELVNLHRQGVIRLSIWSGSIDNIPSSVKAAAPTNRDLGIADSYPGRVEYYAWARKGPSFPFSEKEKQAAAVKMAEQRHAAKRAKITALIEGWKFAEQLEVSHALSEQTPDAFPPDLAGLKVIKPLGGKGGGRARLVQIGGQQWVAKDATAEQDRQQDAVEETYRLFGVPVPKSRWYHEGIRLEEWIDGKPFKEAATSATKAKLAKWLVLDALLGNVDVLGNGDNVVVDAKGVPWRVDFDRALAQRKPLADKPDISRWRQPQGSDPPINAAVYGDISDEELQRQAGIVLAKEQEIIDLMPPELQELMAARLQGLRMGWEQFNEQRPFVT